MERIVSMGRVIFLCILLFLFIPNLTFSYLPREETDDLSLNTAINHSEGCQFPLLYDYILQDVSLIQDEEHTFSPSSYRNFPGSEVTRYLWFEELKLLVPYATPDEILALTQGISAGDSFWPEYDEEYLYARIFSPLFHCRPLSKILSDKNASLEEIVIIQAIALDIAGYETNLVVVPIMTQQGFRQLIFIAYKKPDEQKWQVMENPTLRKLEYSFEPHEKIEDLARDMSPLFEAYWLQPVFRHVSVRDYPTVPSIVLSDSELLANLKNQFLKLCRHFGIDVEGLDYVDSNDILGSLITLFEPLMLPEYVLQLIGPGLIVFRNLTQDLHKFPGGKSTYRSGFRNFSTIVVNHNLDGCVLLHEIAHICHQCLGVRNISALGFRADSQFLDNFYYSGKYDLNLETFAVMVANYVHNPLRLRLHIIERMEAGDFIAVSNYLIIKDYLFSGVEYGDTDKSSIWWTRENDINYIWYRRNGIEHCFLHP
ncbi:MAG: hypothetical protein NC818_03475 [Candidatus Omnitrophica bacterium]|nr:hypothetical protein [Candidatus Omnitrophota bacterium]